MNNHTLTQFDEWITDGSAFAAITMRQWLVSVEEDAPLFPPTYNLEKTEGARRVKNGERLSGFYENSKGEAYGYNIDRLDDGTKVCQIDSVGAQANRMEPIFKRAGYTHLVPPITIQAGQRTVNLLDAGHRAADAIVRFSPVLQTAIDAAFRAIQNDGNAEPLAKIAPTSIVFGSWDSRSTQVKLPRIIRSVIRAYQVESLHRSAQFNPALNYVADEILDEPNGKQQQDAMSELGFSHAPAAWSHGGIIAKGGIRRDAALNLVALRALGIAGAENETDEAAATRLLNLRRYILGLTLVCFTAPAETFLREGCQLVPDVEKKPEWKLVKHDGSHSSRTISHEDALAFATAGATAFVVGDARQGTFDTAGARAALGQTGDERRAARRRSRAAAPTPAAPAPQPPPEA